MIREEKIKCITENLWARHERKTAAPYLWALYRNNETKIKEFEIYGLVDIKMRMLKIPELKQIQGFPKDYSLKGNQTEQKKYIGNAVEVNMAKALIKTTYKALSEHNKSFKNELKR